MTAAIHVPHVCDQRLFIRYASRPHTHTHTRRTKPPSSDHHHPNNPSQTREPDCSTPHHPTCRPKPQIGPKPWIQRGTQKRIHTTQCRPTTHPQRSPNRLPPHYNSICSWARIYHVHTWASCHHLELSHEQRRSSLPHGLRGRLPNRGSSTQGSDAPPHSHRGPQ